MEQLKRLVGDTAIYGVSSIFGRLLNWLLVPLYVVYFKPSEYAIVVELFAFIALFNIIYTLGFETTYFRFSSQQKQTESVSKHPKPTDYQYRPLDYVNLL